MSSSEVSEVDDDDIICLTVLTADLADPGRPGEVLFSIEGPSDAVRGQAVAWALAQGYERAAATLESMVGGPPPPSLFALTINEPHSLMIYVAWPWSPQP